MTSLLGILPVSSRGPVLAGLSARAHDRACGGRV